MAIADLIPWNRNRNLPAQYRNLPAQYNDEPNPFLALHREMNRLFDNFFRGFETPFSAPLGGNAGWSGGWPNVELRDNQNRDNQNEVQVVAELPGMDEKDVDVTLRDGVLTLKGEKKGGGEGSLYSERWHGQFQRYIQLGPEVDPDKASASFRNGVLTVTLAKRPEAQSQVKRIPIGK